MRDSPDTPVSPIDASKGGDPTWAGGLLERRDTCALAAVSLGTASRARARIWGADGLPADAHTLSAVPAGGCLVACTDMLLYHTQVLTPAVAEPHYLGFSARPVRYSPSKIVPSWVPATLVGRLISSSPLVAVVR